MAVSGSAGNRSIVSTIVLAAGMWAASLLAPSGTAAETSITDRNCAAFATQQEAQAWFKAHDGSKTNNVDQLDADRDGIACEHLSGGTEIAPTADDPGAPWGKIGLAIAGIGAAGIGGAFLYTRLHGTSASASTANEPPPVPVVITPDFALPDALPCDPPPPGWPAITPERLPEIATLSEAEYRATVEWTGRADAVLQAVGERCQLCGTGYPLLPEHVRFRAAGKVPFGMERPCDLMVLCDTCADHLGLTSA